MAEKPETKIVRAILNWIKANGGDGYHVHGSLFQRNGEPDIDAHLPGAHIKIEVKTPGKNATKLQAQRLAVYRAAGYLTGVVHSLDEFKALYTEWKRTHEDTETAVNPVSLRILEPHIRRVTKLRAYRLLV